MATRRNMGNVIVGIGGDYRYVPVQEFLVAEEQDVFYSKYPYKLLDDATRRRVARTAGQGTSSDDTNTSTHFQEHNDITRKLEFNIRRSNVIERIRDRGRTGLSQIERDIDEYVTANTQNGNFVGQVHFENLQTYATSRAAHTFLYVGFVQAQNMPNYSSYICWGSHRVPPNVPKEMGLNQYFTMEFNLDLSNSGRGSFRESELRKLVEVVKFKGYDDVSIEWFEDMLFNRAHSFTILDLTIIASFLGVCMDDYVVTD